MSIAPRLRQFLDEQHADYEVIEHRPTSSALQSAQAAHIPAASMAKAVLLDTADNYLLAVVPSDHRIQLTELRAELGQKPRLAQEQEIGLIFSDCEAGAVPALGFGYGIPTIVDDDLETAPDVYIEAGDHRSLIHMDRAEFSRLMQHAQHGRFSEPWSAMD
jgi:Ala-tRNA(Pro) deacylase